MQPGCGIHFLIILYPLVFTPSNRMYLLICHTYCLLYHLFIFWVQFNISNIVLSPYPMSILDIKYYREKKDSASLRGSVEEAS